MSPEEAQALIDKDPKNADVLFPYLGGEDLNQSPTQTAPRWIINFFDWPEEKARRYPDCFSIVQEKIKPERANGEFKDAAARFWWRYWRPRPKLYRTIEPLERVLGDAQSQQDGPAGALCRPGRCSPISSSSSPTTTTSTSACSPQCLHFRWGSPVRILYAERIRYTPSDVFETFPQPPHSDAVAAAGSALDACRSSLMVDRDLGLTDVYNLVHDPAERSDERIQQLRNLHVGLDLAVRDAYGWSDLDLGHGFHDVRGQGVRFTFSPEATDEALDRLLELNKERYEAEVAAGLHTRAKKTKPRKAQPANQGSMFGDDK